MANQSQNIQWHDRHAGQILCASLADDHFWELKTSANFDDLSIGDQCAASIMYRSIGLMEQDLACQVVNINPPIVSIEKLEETPMVGDWLTIGVLK